nr:serine/arginine-rich SC35-like splicing factor SCL28 [Arachis hypogaea]
MLAAPRRASTVWGNTAQGRYSASTRLAKDPRVWNREEYVRLERDSFSVFVDRLPYDISKRELFDRFSWTGRINDIYLSRKMRNGVVYLFAFIRYTTKGGALKAIAEMNHMRIRGSEIFVGEAKYRRDESKGRGAPVEGMAGSRIQTEPQGVNTDKEVRTGELMSSEQRSHGVD